MTAFVKTSTLAVGALFLFATPAFAGFAEGTCDANGPFPEAILGAEFELPCAEGNGVQISTCNSDTAEWGQPIGECAPACPPPENENKVSICHGHQGGWVLIQVSLNAVCDFGAKCGHEIGDSHGWDDLPDVYPGTEGLNCECE